MAFDNVVFPLIVERMTSAPEFNTTIITTGNGNEQRIGNWEDARVAFNAALGVRSDKDLRKLINFFRARKGRLRGFLVKDLIDCDVLMSPFGVGNGSNKIFQLSKTYGDVGNADVRKIFKPIQGTVLVYQGSTLLTEGSQYTVDYTTGILTTVAVVPNGAILSWSGQFYIPCRFADDRLPADEIFIDMVENKAAGNIPDITLLEIRDFQ